SPNKIRDLSSWDLDKATWGGRVEAIGTVPMCCRSTGRLGEGMGCLAGKWGKGSYLLFSPSGDFGKFTLLVPDVVL
nr:hypothetical protein [Tanacetum cinerariifolium]